MLKLFVPIVGMALAFVAPAAAAQAALGPDAALCQGESGRPAVLVTISGFKVAAGKLRVQLYPANSTFLAKGKWLRRIDLPVMGNGPMRVCVAVPKPGEYAIAVRHDTKANGSDWNDGGGFSRNPKLSILNYKPDYRQVAFPVGSGVRPIDVMLNYRKGLSIGPARQG
ncbi:DUF2141 domain-containing protein [Sphingomonas sp.]|jgi:uncharacterized protein (DUF2141 family)|uniref:DUF2141 domain-containing protein n=1 Tax=Sphingomonas sp. TaxID=28214 RepID=UPI002FCAAAD3